MKMRKFLSLVLLASMVLGLVGTVPAVAGDREQVEIRMLQYGLVLDNIDYAKDPIKTAIEEKTNVKLTYETYPGENFDATVELNLAGGTIPDLFHNWGQQPITKKWAEDGVVVKISDIINAEPDRYPILHQVINSPEYKMFNDYYTGDAESAYALYVLQANPDNRWIAGDLTYNRKIMNETGFTEAPTTIEEFMAYGKAAAEKGYIGWYPRNGKLGSERIPTYEYITKAIACPMGTTISPSASGEDPWQGMMQDESGKWYSTTVSDASKEALKLLRQMYDDGTLPAALGTMPDFDETKDRWANDEIGAVSYAVTSPAAFKDILDDYKKGRPEATYEDLVVGPLLKGPDGNYGKQYGTSFWMGANWFIPTSCKYPDRVLDLVEFLFSNDGQGLLFNGIEGTHYTKGADGKIEFNVPAWDEITQMYIQTGGRCNYPPFQFITTSTQKQINWEGSTKTWFEQSKDMVDYTEAINGGFPEYYTYAKPLTDANRANGFVELPPYYAIIALPDELETIRTQLTEISLEYVPSFITGKKDIDAEWADYVKKYEEAGVQQVVDALNQLVGEAEAKFQSFTAK